MEDKNPPARQSLSGCLREHLELRLVFMSGISVVQIRTMSRGAHRLVRAQANQS